jgi:hypothetical protein
MQISKAILLSSAVIGISVLAHLAYTIARDYDSSHAARLEQERLARASAETEHKALSKRLWRQAVGVEENEPESKMRQRMKVGTDLVWGLDDWVKQIAKPNQHQYVVTADSVDTKSFNLSDVEWHDAQHVTVKGYLLVHFSTIQEQKKDEPASAFNWSRDLEYHSDGVDSWWESKRPVFQGAGLINEGSDSRPIMMLMGRSMEEMIERHP